MSRHVSVQQPPQPVDVPVPSTDRAPAPAPAPANRAERRAAARGAGRSADTAVTARRTVRSGRGPRVHTKPVHGRADYAARRSG
jgi:hypothetical protein